RHEREQYELKAEHGRGSRIEHRVNIKPDSMDDDGTMQDRELAERAECDQRGAGIQHQPARTHHQEETQVSPSIAPRAQMRTTRAPRRAEYDRYLPDPPSGKSRLDDHLACELHSGGSKSQLQYRRPIEATEPAVEVRDVRRKEQLTCETQEWISNDPV